MKEQLTLIFDIHGADDPMTAAEFRGGIKIMGMSSGSAARVLGCSDRLVRRWVDGKHGYSIPTKVARWVRTLVACHKAVSVPVNWKRHELAPSVAGED